MKKVLFFDIDGTLLNSELKIPEGVKRELKRLKEAGHYLFVASGRPLAFISNQIIEAGFNGFVLCNGAHVELNHEIIYENRIPYEKVNDLMNLLESVDCEYDFETATDCYIDPSYKDFIEFFILKVSSLTFLILLFKSANSKFFSYILSIISCFFMLNSS